MANNPQFPATYIQTQLATGSNPTGAEVVEVIQSGNSVQLNLNQIFTSIVGTGTVALGGTVGQLYSKNSATPYDATWSNLSSFVIVGNGLAQSGSTAVTIGLASTAALSVLGVTGNAQATAAAIAGTAGQVLRVNDAGAALAFGAIDLANNTASVSNVLPGANYSAANLAAGNVAGGVQGTLPFANGGLGTTSGLQSAVIGFANSTTPTYYPAGQLPCSVTNDNANAGNLGEFLSTSLALASALALSNNLATTVATLSLSAGDWDIWPTVGFTGGITTLGIFLSGSLSNTAGILNTTVVNEGVSIPCFHAAVFTASGTVAVTPQFSVGLTRRSINATTPFYLTAMAGFVTSTCGVYGSLVARRAR